MLPWVLLPGTLCTGACFAPLLAALAERGVDIAPMDFPVGETPDVHAETARLLETGPDRFIACAFSLGGSIALQAALDAPERIAALVLISVNGRADRAENARTRRALVAEAGRIGGDALVRRTLWATYVAETDLGDHVLRDAVGAMAAETSVASFANQAEIAIGRPDMRPSLSGLAMPVLVVSGVEDRVTPVALGAEIAATAARAEHRIIPDAGHFVLMEKPGETAAAIADWIPSAGLDAPARPPLARMEAER